MNELLLFFREKLTQFDIRPPDNVLVEEIQYLSHLFSANQKTNLTAITDWQEAIIKHLIDSLLIVKTDYWQHAEKILDIGSGAGFPGIPLALCHRDREIVLVEANQKKAAFLHQIKDLFKLSNLRIISDRAESVAHCRQYREQFHLVTARAVANLPTLLELATPFCRIGGVFIAYKGPDINEEVITAQVAFEILGSEFVKSYAFVLPCGKGKRNLIVCQKIAATPEKYPRRPGIPNKKPLI
ncbi:MAG TPA: 16S rRNA (guanine(527)-N(7))-methyltransferase RsmG [Firmicutes bacterium]|nr:16S rRNA (guanine(527)-N(7))-methyltransferase RsmG [Bacillota bacterium]